jgi:hypothetical protein
MRSLVLLLLLQGVRVEKVFEKQISPTHVVSLLRNSTQTKITFQIRVEEKANRSRFWDLATLDAPFGYEFVRADSGTVVLRGESDYRFNGPYLKLFFDLQSKKVLKQIEYTDTTLAQIPNALAQRALGVSEEIVNRLKMPPESLSPFEPRTLPQELVAARLPQSTYSQFARARPARVRDGYVEGTSIEEVIGAYQIAGDKIWFGKNFYDGEGTTGVGAIGYFDRTTKKYSFLPIREVSDWSVSNLLIEGDTLWASLVSHPEGADRSGGLLRHNLKSGVTRKYRVDEVIYRIERAPDSLYLSTSNGIYVLKNERLTRYLVEPDIDGKPVIISEEL